MLELVCICESNCRQTIILTDTNEVIIHDAEGNPQGGAMIPDWLAEAIRSAVKCQAEFGGGEE
jgi:hypothetical protein